PAASHRTRGMLTVPRRQWMPPPIGFITTAATRSDDTAARGSTPNPSTRIGVMRAPPPMPVSPTTMPTTNPARLTSSCTDANGRGTAYARPRCAGKSGRRTHLRRPGAAVSRRLHFRLPKAGRFLPPLGDELVSVEALSAIVLLGAALSALVWANVDPASYASTWHHVTEIGIGDASIAL